ncbi:MAG: hypothetical protein D6706_06180 [Chloroflexi bacterium]|nr:MAG: hypothetical protein D6706_06180 [Chloroflexota bacterium]
MPAVLGLFNIFALIYVFRSVQLTAVIWREWQTLNQEPLTTRKKQLAEQASFFIAVPVGVFLHEMGHAIATWLFGGRVIEFGYRVFWGYVIPAGTFTPSQDWFISLAGTIGSLLYGLALWLLLRRARTTFLRYFGLRAFRFQVYFSLIYYPIFTLLLSIGDWRTIYNFSATPLLSSLTIPLHALLLGLFWWGDRIGWFEMPVFATLAEQQRFEQLAQESGHNPEAQLALCLALLQGRAVNKARHLANKLFRQHQTQSGDLAFVLALLELERKSHISRKAQHYLEQALQLGLTDSYRQAYAYQKLAQYYLERDKVQDALRMVEAGITAVSPLVHKENGRSDTPLVLAQLLHQRGRSFLRLKQYEQAYSDIQQALALAQAANATAAIKFYQEELALVERHAGRKLDLSPPHVP